MPKMPLTPEISPRIELCHLEPKAYLVRDEEWTCPECDDHYALDIDGRDRECVCCLIKRSGKTSITLFGWKIQKSVNQLLAQPPLHRVDGK